VFLPQHNDLGKTSSSSSEAEDMLEKVIGQLKLENRNSRALRTQNEELKKLVVKIWVYPNIQVQLRNCYRERRQRSRFLGRN